PAGPGQLSVNNVTVANNTAPAGSGGSIFSSAGGQFEVSNTIVANGAGGNCTGLGLTSLGDNLASDATCPLNAAGDLNNLDPKLGPLQNNGGWNLTHNLLTGSPALDAGNPATPLDGQGGRCPSVDQRFEPRPRDRNNDGQYICDIGS